MQLLVAAIATPLLPSAVQEPNIIAETDFGFTFGPVTTNAAYSEYDEIIRDTLREKAAVLANSVEDGKSVLLKIKDNDYVRINTISPEVQTQRMIDRINSRRQKFDHDLRTNPYNTIYRARKRADDDRRIFYEGYEPLDNVIARQMES